MFIKILHRLIHMKDAQLQTYTDNGHTTTHVRTYNLLMKNVCKLPTMLLLLLTLFCLQNGLSAIEWSEILPFECGVLMKLVVGYIPRIYKIMSSVTPWLYQFMIPSFGDSVIRYYFVKPSDMYRNWMSTFSCNYYLG